MLGKAQHIAAQAFLQLPRAGPTPPCSAWTSHCSGFFCRRAWPLGHEGFSSWACGFSSWCSWALEHRLRSCGGFWNLPRPGMESVSPALAGGFFATEPPGKPLFYLLKYFPSRSLLSDVSFSCYHSVADAIYVRFRDNLRH